MAKHPQTALVSYLRDELAAGERAQVARHLEGCAECRELRDSLADIIAELVRWIEEVPTPDPLAYRAELARKLASREAAHRRLWWPRFAWVPLATVSALAIASILMLGIHRQPSVPSVEQLTTEYEMSDAGIGLLRDYPVVTHLDLLENYDVIEHLNELPETDDHHHSTQA